jgi:hypothetical protein
MLEESAKRSGRVLCDATRAGAWQRELLERAEVIQPTRSFGAVGVPLAYHVDSTRVLDLQPAKK